MPAGHYHLSVQVLSRSQGKDCVAAAAYRSGTRLWNAERNTFEDYQNRPDVQHTAIIAPAEAPTWVYDRERLWQNVQQVEKRRDAQTARELRFALPRELSSSQQVKLAETFLQARCVALGMVVDYAIHNDPANHNPHVHALLTTRRISAAGFGNKERAWNERQLVKDWRAAWSEEANKALRSIGCTRLLDHRSYAARGIAKQPGRKTGRSRQRHQQARWIYARKTTQQLPQSRFYRFLCQSTARRNFARYGAKFGLRAAYHALEHTPGRFGLLKTRWRLQHDQQQRQQGFDRFNGRGRD
jgi:ATP-dependent exoDNAse (exonuclease V) alpha subunit